MNDDGFPTGMLAWNPSMPKRETKYWPRRDVYWRRKHNTAVKLPYVSGSRAALRLIRQTIRLHLQRTLFTNIHDADTIARIRREFDRVIAENNAQWIAPVFTGGEEVPAIEPARRFGTNEET